MSAIQGPILTSALLHNLWETLRCMYGPGFGGTPDEPTADILRYKESATTGQNYARGTAGTPVLEVELAGIPVAVTPVALFAPNRRGISATLEAGQRLFIFKEIPGTANYDPDTLLASDVIRYEDRLWGFAGGSDLWNDPNSRLSLGTFELVEP